MGEMLVRIKIFVDTLFIVALINIETLERVTQAIFEKGEYTG